MQNLFNCPSSLGPFLTALSTAVAPQRQQSSPTSSVIDSAAIFIVSTFVPFSVVERPTPAVAPLAVELPPILVPPCDPSSTGVYSTILMSLGMQTMCVVSSHFLLEAPSVETAMTGISLSRHLARIRF